MNEKEKGLFVLAKQWDEMQPRIQVALSKIAAHLKILSEHLVNSATGKDHIPTKTATLIFKILGFVIVALVLMIIFLLTGDHFSLLPHLKDLQ